MHMTQHVWLSYGNVPIAQCAKKSSICVVSLYVDPILICKLGFVAVKKQTFVAMIGRKDTKEDLLFSG